MRDVVFAEEDSMGGGTIFKAIGKSEIEQIPVLVAPDALVRDDRGSDTRGEGRSYQSIDS